eukprot:CAMPEP_0118697756 /NCGR_PEP_ID=MMETSP0800-20121206/14734_1 /TAXON_ID=210618 ORGANISM="Striatella unipunctata, Strain CCMP2910" /NCGR_SAMPLE_ID=MMETSP0800 /ASSEMBLY_ACC=CAM_ASM_000638 /LENGTH=233 /DNA_ID=CAMNT_0006597325 /DNA_START=57 /DNA_END=755 /DNA_ORIENTATION=-
MILKRQRLVEGILDATVNSMFLITETGSIVEVNKTAIENFGYEKDELCGKNISLIVGGGHAANHDSYLKRYVQTGEAKVIGKNRELVARRKDGTEFFIELSVKEIVTEEGDERLFVGFLRSLTQQKAYEAEIKRKEEFSEKIIESARDALLVIDKDRWIKRVNEAAVCKYGMTRENLCRCCLDWLLLADDAKWLESEIGNYLDVGMPFTEDKELQAKHSDGSWFPVSLSISEL